METGKKLLEARTAAGLTRKQLAELAGVNFRIIEAYEQGVRNINLGKVNIIRAIAQALKVSIEDLLDDEVE